MLVPGSIVVIVSLMYIFNLRKQILFYKYLITSPYNNNTYISLLVLLCIVYSVNVCV